MMIESKFLLQKILIDLFVSLFLTQLFVFPVDFIYLFVFGLFRFLDVFLVKI